MHFPKIAILMATIALTLTACNKSTDATDKTASSTTTVSENAKILSTAILYSTVATAIEQQKLEGEAKSCVLKIDDSQIAVPLQKILDTHVKPEDNKAIEEFYANGFGERAHQYSKQMMMLLMGESQTPPTLSAEDQAKLESIATIEAFKNADQSLPVAEVEQLAIQAVNAELKRCKLPELKLDPIPVTPNNGQSNSADTKAKS